MHDGLSNTLERFVSAGDQFRASLSQDLDGDIVRNLPLLNQLAHEIKIRL